MTSLSFVTSLRFVTTLRFVTSPHPEKNSRDRDVRWWFRGQSPRRPDKVVELSRRRSPDGLHREGEICFALFALFCSVSLSSSGFTGGEKFSRSFLLAPFCYYPRHFCSSCFLPNVFGQSFFLRSVFAVFISVFTLFLFSTLSTLYLSPVLARFQLNIVVSIFGLRYYRSVFVNVFFSEWWCVKRL